MADLRVFVLVLEVVNAVHHHEKDSWVHASCGIVQATEQPRRGILRGIWQVSSRIFKRKNKEIIHSFWHLQTSMHFSKWHGKPLIRLVRTGLWSTRKPPETSSLFRLRHRSRNLNTSNSCATTTFSVSLQKRTLLWIDPIKHVQFKVHPMPSSVDRICQG